MVKQTRRRNKLLQWFGLGLGGSLLAVVGLLWIGLFGWIPDQPEGPWLLPTADLPQGLHLTHKSMYSGLQGYFKRGGDVIYFETRYQYFHPAILLLAGELIAISAAKRGFQGQILSSIMAGDRPSGWPEGMPDRIMLPNWASGFLYDFRQALIHSDLGWWHQRDIDELIRL